MTNHHHTGTPSTAERLADAKRVRIILAAMLVPMILATGVAALFLWPSSTEHKTPENLGPPAELVNADVTSKAIGLCPNDPSGNTCTNVGLVIRSGVDENKSVQLAIPLGPSQPTLEAGDKIVVGRSADTVGTVDYYFSDFQRKPALGWLAFAFAALAVLVARWRGIGALLGVGITWLVLVQFMLPAILEGKSPLLVAVTGSAAIVLVVLYVAHGFSARTTTAVIATLVSLVATGVLASLAVDATQLTGFSSEEVTFVQSYAGNIDVRGLILGGVVLGALGVLNDMTVSQTSTIREINIAQPNLSFTQLYTAGMRVGRDHIASTVYTLILAYVGASLPLLVLFTIANRPFGEVIGGDLVGQEVVRTLVGSIGLILSVPIATALSAMVEKSRHVPVGGMPAVAAVSGTPHGDKATDDDWSMPARPEPTAPEADNDIPLPEPPKDRPMTRKEKKFWDEE